MCPSSRPGQYLDIRCSRASGFINLTLYIYFLNDEHWPMTSSLILCFIWLEKIIYNVLPPQYNGLLFVEVVWWLLRRTSCINIVIFTRINRTVRYSLSQAGSCFLPPCRLSSSGLTMSTRMGAVAWVSARPNDSMIRIWVCRSLCLQVSICFAMR